jgi:hypothetical protein
MTFPLMSGAVIRRYPATPGRALAMLYFTNSLGAGIGVLVAGFVMIEHLGLPGTVQAAGAVNLAVAALVVLVARLAPREALPANARTRGGFADAGPAPGNRCPDGGRFLHIRDRLDPHADPRPRSRNAFLRADALRFHTRARLRRSLDTRPHRPHRRAAPDFSASCRS